MLTHPLSLFTRLFLAVLYMSHAHKSRSPRSNVAHECTYVPKLLLTILCLCMLTSHPSVCIRERITCEREIMKCVF